MNTCFYDNFCNKIDNDISTNNSIYINKSIYMDSKYINNIYDKYYLSIRNNITNKFKEIYLTESEFNIIKTAIKYNNGIINLLGHKEEVHSLYRKGLIEISNDELEIAVVSDLILKLLSPKVLENRNILLSNNKDIHSNNKYKNNTDNVEEENNIEEENKELGLNLGINNISNTYNNTYNNTYKTNKSINSTNSTNSINSINSLFDGNEDEYLLEENRPNSIFKIFDNIDVCFCCLL